MYMFLCSSERGGTLIFLKEDLSLFLVISERVPLEPTYLLVTAIKTIARISYGKKTFAYTH